MRMWLNTGGQSGGGARGGVDRGLLTRMSAKTEERKKNLCGVALGFDMTRCSERMVLDADD